MKNKKKWDVLILSGDINDIDIISSYIKDDSLGSYLNKNKYFYYFDIGKKDLIESVLNVHIVGLNINFSWEIIEHENWHLNWKNNFNPIQIKDELIIIPNWDNNIYNHKHIVKIKPGMAFGTGHHETTFLMLKNLIKYINKNDRVLDLGSGSGILSIVSYMYNASKITAIEYDKDCKDNFIEKLQINNINNNNIEFIIDDVLTCEDFNYDIILANINKNIIKDLLPKLKKTNAKILLSGMLDQDELEIKSLLKLYNMNLIYKDQRNEWIFMKVQND